MKIVAFFLSALDKAVLCVYNNLRMILKLEDDMSGYQTEQKRMLLQFLTEHRDTAFSVEEIAERMKREGQSAPGKSTVYRLVLRLLEEKQIRRFVGEDGRRFLYQLVADEHCHEHLHLKCRICERLIHLDKSTTEHIMNYINSADSFMLDPTEILGGICGLCKERERKNASSVSASHV